MGKIGPVLAFIKKNLLSLLCGLVAIAAIIAWQWPISGYFSTLQSTADARKTAYSTLTGLIKKQRTLPVLDPLSPDAQPLTVFPTESIIDRGQKVTKAVHDESDLMMQTAMGLVSHKPLVPDALPNGGTFPATLFLREFQKLYPSPVGNNPGGNAGFNPGFNPGNNGNTNGGPPPVAEADHTTLAATILQAGQPPTQAEIQQQLDAIKNQITSEKTQYDSSGHAVNAPAVSALILAAQLAAPDAMKNAVAVQHRMYISPDAYHLHSQLTGVNPPSTLAMFNGQITLWLIQDVFNALASANVDSKNGVRTSKLKHLIKIDFPEQPLGAGLTPDAVSAPGGTAPPPSDPLHPTIDKTKSPTGHVSNGWYDVIPFNLKLIVDAESVPDVLLALSRNQFITTLRTDVLSVDAGQFIDAGYIYGDKQVVQLNISAEELFFHTDTTPWMPDAIKRALNIQPTAPAAATP